MDSAPVSLHDASKWLKTNVPSNYRHRVLAELLEQGTRTTLTIPVHKPTPSINPSSSQQTLRTTAGVEYDALRSLGINPSHALQHPGVYYYIAARCTEIRRSCFLAVVEAEVRTFLHLVHYNLHGHFYSVAKNLSRYLLDSRMRRRLNISPSSTRYN